MAYNYADRVWFFTPTAGTGTINVGLALAGYQTPLVAGLATGNDVGYTLIDGTNWEAGTGTLTSGATWTLSRDIVEQSSSGTAKISLSGAATCFITAPAGLINAVAGIANIAALRASRTIMANVAQVMGYATAADGGEGRFTLVESDTTSADDGGTIIVDASGRRWHRDLVNGPVSVRWFGAKGDGTTNDTAAFNSCLSAASSVYVPAGTYRLNTAISKTLTATLQGFSITGDGPEVSKLVFVGGGMTITTYDQWNAVTVRGLAFCAQTNNTQTGLYLTCSPGPAASAQASEVLIENCIWRGTTAYQVSNQYWQYSLRIFDVSNVNIIGCLFAAPNGHGVGISLSGTGLQTVMPPVVYNISCCTWMGHSICVNYGAWIQGVSISQSNCVLATNFLVTPNVPTSDPSWGWQDQLSIVASQLACTNTVITLAQPMGNLILTGNLLSLQQSVQGQAATCIVLQGLQNNFAITGNCITGEKKDNGGISIAGSVQYGGCIVGNNFQNFFTGLSLGAGSNNVNVQSNLWALCTVVVDNEGTNNVIGGGTP